MLDLTESTSEREATATKAICATVIGTCCIGVVLNTFSWNVDLNKLLLIIKLKKLTL